MVVIRENLGHPDYKASFKRPISYYFQHRKFGMGRTMAMILYSFKLFTLD